MPVDHAMPATAAGAARVPMRKALLALAGAALFTDAAAAEAQRPLGAGISVGAAAPVADLGESHNTGYGVTAHLRANVPRVPVSLRLEGFWHVFAARAEGIIVDRGDMRIAGGNVNVFYHFAGARIRPYVTGGGGLYNAKYVGSSPIDFGVNGGVGGRFQVAGAHAFAEARLNRISDDDRQFRFVPITVGIEF